MRSTLFVVLGIVVALGAAMLLIPGSSGPCGGYDQRRIVAEAQMKAIVAALEEHERAFNSLPENAEGLEQFVGQLPLDPWGTPYAYSSDGKGYRIVSLGADRRIGGEGDGADFGPN